MSHPKYKFIGSPLTKLMEECAEVIHASCKIDKFGWFGYNPEDPKKITNMDKLHNEIGDLREVICGIEVEMEQQSSEQMEKNE